ncbi:protein of unknown function [Methylococcus capsulatus]|uniref:Uncharacterized protein n=1 Tax=Methylococcus capsulatus TaxID=414 RepID=A0AA35UJB3_METCP|nr:protein of unknown function [Methylococcus capsulatus]
MGRGAVPPEAGRGWGAQETPCADSVQVPEFPVIVRRLEIGGRFELESCGSSAQSYVKETG